MTGSGLEQADLLQIYQRNVDSVYRLCYSYMKNAVDAEDMVQETFLRLIRSGKTFENSSHERAWLIVTASNLCKDNLKHWWRKRQEPDIISTDEDGDSGALREALCRLPAELKTVVYLYYYEGYSTREIAQHLHCAEGTVRSRLARARERLKTMLGGEFYE